MSIIFRYVHVRRADGTLRKAPFIPILLRDRNGRLIQNVALVDSGADMTIVPKDLAKVLGLAESTYDEHTGGIGGNVKVKKSNLSFQLKGDHEKYNLEVPVLILQDGNSDVPLLLGRNGLFENFHITFKQDEEKIILTKIGRKF